MKMWPTKPVFKRKRPDPNKPHFEGTDAYVNTESMNGLTRISFPIKAGGVCMYDFFMGSSGKYGMRKTLIDAQGKENDAVWQIGTMETHNEAFSNYLKEYCALTTAMPEDEVEKLFSMGVHRLTAGTAKISTVHLSAKSGLTFKRPGRKEFHAPKLPGAVEI